MGVALEQHLSECPQCRAAYDRFHATTLLLDEMPEAEPPPDFHANLMARLERARRTAPKPVRWWHLDWPSVFTVRVPARAIAMAAVLILVFTALFRMTPLSGIAANVLGLQKAPHSSPYINGVVPAPKPYGAGSTAKSKSTGVGPGLLVGVRVDSNEPQGTVYIVQLSTDSTKPIGFNTYLVPENALNRGINESNIGNLVYTGYVTQGQGAAVKIEAGQPGINQRAKAALIVWRYANQNYSEIMFLPSGFGTVNANHSLSLSNVGIYDAFAELSSNYGIVIMAPGSWSQSTSISVNARTGETAMANAMQQLRLFWRPVASSVYIVGAGE